jgi:quercetin dioxygenase-like cupin family protein
MSVVTAVESDILNVVGDRVRVLVDGADRDSTFELFLVEGDLGSGPPPHAHQWLEAYYVLDGKLLVEIGGEQTLTEPGTSAVVKAGEVHRFEIATSNAPGAPTPENLSQIVEVAKRNGLTSPLF